MENNEAVNSDLLENIDIRIKVRINNVECNGGNETCSTLGDEDILDKYGAKIRQDLFIAILGTYTKCGLSNMN